MTRSHNFSAGPAILPEAVLRQAQSAIWELGDTGVGLLECSHRSAAFDEVIGSARNRIHRLLGCDEDQEVLFMHGGARTQFFQIPMNLLRGGTATYLDTGTWGKQAADEAARYGNVVVPFTDWASCPQGFADVAEGSSYLHYTSNNTVAGTQFHDHPDPGDALLICDTSSDFLSRPLDGSKYAILYGGAQKNVGPSGVTVVVFRKSLLERCDPDLPTMLRYETHVKKRSMFNTPCTFGIWMIERVCAWIEDQGGLQAIDANNRAQAGRIYATIDGSDFWQGKAAADSRSLMNVTFTTGDAALDTTFVAEAAAAGLSGLKGHSRVGGLRASIYNAQVDASIDALVAFMNDFEGRHG